MMYKIGCIVLGLTNTILAGVVFMVGWGWFIQPLGLPTVSFWQALGLITMVTLLIPIRLNDIIDVDFIKASIINLIKMLICLFAMSLYQFMM